MHLRLRGAYKRHLRLWKRNQGLPMSISKGVALITGSAHGIGRAIALRLAKDGFDIGLNDLASKRSQLDNVAEDINTLGRKTCLAMADVTVEEQVRGMVQGVTKELGGLDIMVANAGVDLVSSMTSTELDDWERVMAINARGPFLCYKHAATQMIKQGRGGRLIAASSVAGKIGFHLTSAYCASKFAVRGLTQATALELGRYGITVNSYAPGLIRTAMKDRADAVLNALKDTEPELVDSFRSHLTTFPIKRAGQPEEVAGIVSYLASKEAQFVTGQCISIDGGLVMS